MQPSLSEYFHFAVLSGLCLLILTGCGYQRPDGEWLLLDASAIRFTVVELGQEAIDPNYAATCEEARDEIYTQLSRKLPAKIAPLELKTGKTPSDNSAGTASLKLIITDCEIDVDQSGGTFSYYLTLPVQVVLTQNGKNLLTYDMATYEQISVDAPGPEFEFTFAEPVARTLLLFDDRRLWRPAD